MAALSSDALAPALADGSPGGDVDGDLNTFFILWASSLVIFMQVGFALIEAGRVQSKNVRTVVLKNTLENGVGAIMWFCVGFPLSRGSGNAVLAWEWPQDAQPDPRFLAVPDSLWLYGFAFASSTATIVSGALAERTRLLSHLVFVLVCVGFVYPLAAHWVWNPHGWLSPSGPVLISPGVVDVAGSGVVHMLGGGCALIGAYITGPRLTHHSRSPHTTPTHHGPNGPPLPPLPPEEGPSPTLLCLGAFILWFTFYGFNIGSVGGLTNHGAAAARVAVATTLASGTGSLAASLFALLVPSIGLSVPVVANGMIAGLVSVAGPCAVVPTWAAIPISAVAAVASLAFTGVCSHAGIDDVVDAGPVHYVGGLVGIISTAFFAHPVYLGEYLQSVGGRQVDVGIFFGGSGRLLAVQLLAAATITLWAMLWGSVVFGALRAAQLLRVSLETEVLGMDSALFEERQRNGASAYALLQQTRSVEPEKGAPSESALELPWRRQSDSPMVMERPPRSPHAQHAQQTQHAATVPLLARPPRPPQNSSDEPGEPVSSGARHHPDASPPSLFTSGASSSLSSASSPLVSMLRNGSWSRQQNGAVAMHGSSPWGWGPGHAATAPLQQVEVAGAGAGAANHHSAEAATRAFSRVMSRQSAERAHAASMARTYNSNGEAGARPRGASAGGHVAAFPGAPPSRATSRDSMGSAGAAADAPVAQMRQPVVRHSDRPPSHTRVVFPRAADGADASTRPVGAGGAGAGVGRGGRAPAGDSSVMSAASGSIQLGQPPTRQADAAAALARRGGLQRPQQRRGSEGPVDGVAGWGAPATVRAAELAGRPGLAAASDASLAGESFSFGPVMPRADLMRSAVHAGLGGGGSLAAQAGHAREMAAARDSREHEHAVSRALELPLAAAGLMDTGSELTLRGMADDRSLPDSAVYHDSLLESAHNSADQMQQPMPPWLASLMHRANASGVSPPSPAPPAAAAGSPSGAAGPALRNGHTRIPARSAVGTDSSLRGGSGRRKAALSLSCGRRARHAVWTGGARLLPTSPEDPNAPPRLHRPGDPTADMHLAALSMENAEPSPRGASDGSSRVSSTRASSSRHASGPRDVFFSAELDPHSSEASAINAALPVLQHDSTGSGIVFGSAASSSECYHSSVQPSSSGSSLDLQSPPAGMPPPPLVPLRASARASSSHKPPLAEGELGGKVAVGRPGPSLHASFYSQDSAGEGDPPLLPPGARPSNTAAMQD